MDMKRCAFFCLRHSFRFFSLHPYLGCPTNNSQLFLGSCLSKRLSSLSSTNTRPFPNYSPKQPTIRDSELIHQVSNVIRSRRSEPLRRVLNPYESKFRHDHVIWVLMNIKSDYKLVLDFLDWACLRRDPNLETQCIVVQIAVSSNDLKMAHELFRDFWAKPNLDIGHAFGQFVVKLIYTYEYWGSEPHVFDVLFQVIVEAGMLIEARDFFSKLLNFGMVMSTDSCNLYLARLSNNGDGLGMTLKVFREFPQVSACWNTKSYNIIMNSLCQAGLVKEAHSLLLQMECRGYNADVVSYSTIINVYCGNSYLETVLKLVEEMHRKKLKPKSCTYNSIILLMCKSGKVFEAEKVLREMIGQGIIPDNVLYTTLIVGFCNLGNTQAAYKLFDEMEAWRIVPDLIVYTAIIYGLCQNGKTVEAGQFFSEMLSRGLEPDEVTYTTLIDGHCKSGDMTKAFSLHNQMVRVGLTPNVVTCTALADGLCKVGELDTANELLHEISRKGLQLNVCTYNSLIYGLCKAGNIAQAVKLMEEMELAGMHPNTITFTTLMDAYCKTGQMFKAHELLREMLARGLQPTVVTFNVLMNGFCMA